MFKNGICNKYFYITVFSKYGELEVDKNSFVILLRDNVHVSLPSFNLNGL
jgi:hypothetical protein